MFVTAIGSGRLGRAVLLGACLAALGGCAEGFDPPEELRSLRVMAVKKDLPYPRPGDEVALQMLWHDAADDAPRPVEILWLSGCFNPPGDLFQGCFEQIASPAALELGRGDQYSFTLPDDLISSRPPPRDPKVPPFGSAFVFFAVCAGELSVDPTQPDFPLVCERDGVTLGAEDFVVGFTLLYAYDALDNHNPIITGLEFDGAVVDTDCLGEACQAVVLPEREPGEPAPCVEPAVHVPACQGECDTLPIRPLLEEDDNAEVDGVLTALRGEPLEEQMWINYYVDRGELDSGLRLLNDATTGWNADYGTEYRPPAEPGLAHLWAVAHDNRGGTDWMRVRLCVE